MEQTIGALVLGRPSAAASARSAPAGSREKKGMKVLSATLIALALAAFATTASAHVVEITTSIDVGRASNEKDLKAALESTIDDAVKHTIRFTPTVVTVQNARRVGDKIYLVLLIVDHDGEEMIKQLASDAATESPEPLTQPDDIRSL